MQADVNMRIFPVMPDLWWIPLAPKMMINTAPERPSRTPIMRCREKRSVPMIIESISTNRGVMVLIIEPSMGEVLTSPNIIHNLRDMPIRSEAIKIFTLSARSIRSRRSHNNGISDHTAAIVSEAETIASGDM